MIAGLIKFKIKNIFKFYHKILANSSNHWKDRFALFLANRPYSIGKTETFACSFRPPLIILAHRQFSMIFSCFYARRCLYINIKCLFISWLYPLPTTWHSNLRSIYKQWFNIRLRLFYLFDVYFFFEFFKSVFVQCSLWKKEEFGW